MTDRPQDGPRHWFKDGDYLIERPTGRTGRVVPMPGRPYPGVSHVPVLWDGTSAPVWVNRLEVSKIHPLELLGEQADSSRLSAEDE